MNIQNISKNDRAVIARLSADDLVAIGNSLFATVKEDSPEYIKRLYADIMMARDLCQYGHIDDFCFNCILAQRKV